MSERAPDGVADGAGIATELLFVVWAGAALRFGDKREDGGGIARFKRENLYLTHDPDVASAPFADCFSE